MRFKKLCTSLCKIFTGRVVFRKSSGKSFFIPNFPQLDNQKFTPPRDTSTKFFLTSINLPLPPPQLTPCLFLTSTSSLSPLRCALFRLASTFPLSVLSPPPHLILPPPPHLISTSLRGLASASSSDFDYASSPHLASASSPGVSSAPLPGLAPNLTLPCLDAPFSRQALDPPLPPFTTILYCLHLHPAES